MFATLRKGNQANLERVPCAHTHIHRILPIKSICIDIYIEIIAHDYIIRLGYWYWYCETERPTGRTMNDSHILNSVCHVIWYSNLVPILIVYCGMAATLRDVWLMVMLSLACARLLACSVNRQYFGMMAGWLNQFFDATHTHTHAPILSFQWKI